MNEITLFQFEKSEVRTTRDKEGNPWFAANDVCRILEITNPRDAISKLDDDEKDVAFTDTLGGEQEINIISESGLYTLIIRSNKPQAKRFRRWVTHEVLPSIRKTGAYAIPEDMCLVKKQLLPYHSMIDICRDWIKENGAVPFTVRQMLDALNEKGFPVAKHQVQLVVKHMGIFDGLVSLPRHQRKSRTPEYVLWEKQTLFPKYGQHNRQNQMETT